MLLYVLAILQVACWTLTSSKAVTLPTKKTNIELLMPDVQPKVPDTYLCHSIKMNKTATYITGFVPHAQMETAHHMLLYGCSEPGDDAAVWNCGEMAQSDNTGNFKLGPTCQSGSKILYAWAMDATSLDLPQGVAFKVGGNTNVNYLVLQVHYKNVDKFLPPKSETDNSGITLVTTKTPMPKRAGVYLLGTMGSIPQHSTVYMESACSFMDDLDIVPFAFRTHTHQLGKVVSGYRIRDGEWTEIGRQNPRLPQMFYNATTPNMDVSKGDILAARCTMKNDLDHEVRIGSTQNDEMCNFYIMYYVNGDQIMNRDYCFSAGPDTWYWDDFDRADEMNLGAVPKTASVVPGTSEVLRQTSFGGEGNDGETSIDQLVESLGEANVEELLKELYQSQREDDLYTDDSYDLYPRRV
ncbi:peptidylglycine alpha-hydroxylating monooxygenase-like [Liolophura sinensis]|uniref:peptidylglycine alpha-hydroxylating monooxygenase-like n=1 Tax=Liolophura sinensis TaxID=3198878 RepID=UPI003157FCA9